MSQGLDSQPAPYTVMHNTSFSVKASDDKEVCDIHGMCQMPDGSIIVADHANKCLKQLDNTYNVTSRCSLKEAPNDVCVIDAGQVAVATQGQEVQFVSVGNKMTRTQSFYTDDLCESLAYSNDCLFVTEAYMRAAIHVYIITSLVPA